MADVLVMEFAAPGAADIYQKVGDLLGEGITRVPENMPSGLSSHVAGVDGDRLIVVEVWESREHQEAFMQTQLGPALAKTEAPAPTRFDWFSGLSDDHRH